MTVPVGKLNSPRIASSRAIQRAQFRTFSSPQPVAKDTVATELVHSSAAPRSGNPRMITPASWVAAVQIMRPSPDKTAMIRLNKFTPAKKVIDGGQHYAIGSSRRFFFRVHMALL